MDDLIIFDPEDGETCIVALRGSDGIYRELCTTNCLETSQLIIKALDLGGGLKSE